MDRKFLIIAGVILIAIAAVGSYIYFDEKTVDAEPEVWELYKDSDGSVSALRQGQMTALDSLDDVVKGDVVFIGRTWSENNLDQSVEDRINEIAESGILVMTLGNNLEPFGTFMEKHSYEFEEDAYIHSIHMFNGIPCTGSFTVPGEVELGTWIGYWEVPFIIPNFSDRTIDWEYEVNSFSIRYLWEDAYVMKTRHFLTDADDPDFILSVEEYQSVTNRDKEMDNGLRSVTQKVTVGKPGTDKILEFSPTVDSYNKNKTVMTAHGNVEINCPNVCDKFIQKYYLDEKFSIEYNMMKDFRKNTITLYPAYIAESSGEFTAHTDMSVVIEKNDMRDNQRYTFGYDVCLKERA